jgi:DNA-directed RNA polymerase subunit F
MLVNTVSPNADVVQEVAKLREEFTKQFEKLREEQAQQAAAAIVNNTVVNDNAANKIIDALEQDSGSTWNDRVTSDGP